MNADLKRVRDSSMDDALSPHNKKRAFLGASSPPVESGDDDKQDWMEVVETKRKEAIYRQMLEYRRFYEEEARRADAVEAQKRVLEASVQAVEICWNQVGFLPVIQDAADGKVLSTIQDIMGTQEIPPESLERELSLSAPLNLAPLDQLPTPELEAALQARLPQTQSLLSRFTAASSSGSSLSTADLQKQLARLQGDVAISRSGRQSLQAQVSSLSDSRDTYKRELQRAQKSLDRQRMEHDKAEASWRELSTKAPREATPKPNGSGHATPNGVKEEESKPVINGPTAAMLPDTSEIERVADARLKEIQQLVLEQTRLKQDLDQLRISLDSPSETSLRSSPWFQIYLNQLSAQLARANDLQARLEKSENSLDNVRNTNGAFRDMMVAEEAKKCEALQQQLAKQNSELARIRGQRDDLTAELSERKLKDTDRMKYGEQMEMLANTREGRIKYLQSEVMRLKGQLGAESGSKGYLAFLHAEGVDADYVKDLERRLKDFEGANGEQKSCEADLRREVERYEKVIGDATDLAKRLEEVTGAKEALELKLKEAQGSTDALYTEVEGLSKLWEDLQRDASTKVFSHKDAELRIQRAVTEKAKADNKYFLAMREKEALDAENKNLQRVLDKQGKFVDAAKETEVALKAQLAAQEKILSSVKNEALHLQTSLATTSSEKHSLESKLGMATNSLTQAQELLRERVAEHGSEKELRIKLQEEVEATTRQNTKLKERQDTIMANGASAGGDDALREENNKLLKLLRCSCCEQAFKQQVIVKCMHRCLDARIASRQRKCPACGLAFAKEDVQTLYWQ